MFEKDKEKEIQINQILNIVKIASLAFPAIDSFNIILFISAIQSFFCNRAY
ncbi:hypothetical protein SDC9_183373 [bioreactor metagenome]|uniref:Uncharacterized protein n=1 Tax=bioreactor metagenome TaxID=1076179 RepID=A0A645HA11_9ZZZZ